MQRVLRKQTVAASLLAFTSVVSHGTLAGGGLAKAQSTAAASGASAPVLLELFTSEGCSSCPPADALLRKLDGTTSSSGQLLIALSEHVTYWNRLGWSDPFSSDVFTERQNGYGQRFHLESVYTPQLVINGTAEVVGSNAAQIAAALSAQRSRSPSLDLHIVSARVTTQSSGANLSLTYSASATPSGRAELYVAIADDLDQSNVLRGENGGRSLSHVAVVRNLVRAGRLRPGDSQTIEVSIPRQQSPGTAKQHVVLFAQSPAYGPILGVDSHSL